MKNILILIPVILFFSACTRPGPQGCFPSDRLPSHISPLTGFGSRAEWSLNGEKVFFVDSAGGDAWMVDIHSKKTEKITKPDFRPEGHGYYRVICLANGDYLLTCGPSRHDLYMQVLDKSMEKQPVRIPGEQIDEGPAVSRKNMKIAWTPRQDVIFTGEIVNEEGIPRIANKKLVIDSSDVVVDSIKYRGILEPQSFGKDERELIWSQYGIDTRGVFTSEVMGYDLGTGALVNYSCAPLQYDEPEGIFPGGEFTLVECDRHSPGGTPYIDIYKLMLDKENPEYTRLTFFSDVKGYRSSNPVVSDDGKMIAFQASLAGSAAGDGCGLYLFDLEKFENTK